MLNYRTSRYLLPSVGASGTGKGILAVPFSQGAIKQIILSSASTDVDLRLFQGGGITIAAETHNLTGTHHYRLDYLPDVANIGSFACTSTAYPGGYTIIHTGTPAAGEVLLDPWTGECTHNAGDTTDDPTWAYYGLDPTAAIGSVTLVLDGDWQIYKKETINKWMKDSTSDSFYNVPFKDNTPILYYHIKNNDAGNATGLIVLELTISALEV
ncbi:MAG: hypothetical protein DRG33_01560 [Deltaproteobacteria bacterium]|nr:MAG: hypothetical protein DRG33_01560 [Deltaproteobacteria bacterium]